MEISDQVWNSVGILGSGSVHSRHTSIGGSVGVIGQQIKTIAVVATAHEEELIILGECALVGTKRDSASSITCLPN